MVLVLYLVFSTHRLSPVVHRHLGLLSFSFSREPIRMKISGSRVMRHSWSVTETGSSYIIKQIIILVN